MVSKFAASYMKRIKKLKIKRRSLITIAIVVAAFGLLILSLGAQDKVATPISISDVATVEQGTYVSVNGVVKSVDVRDKQYSIRICESSTSSDCVSILISKFALTQTLIEGDFVSVEATTLLYRGYTYLVVEQASEISITPQSMNSSV